MSLSPARNVTQKPRSGWSGLFTWWALGMVVAALVAVCLLWQQIGGWDGLLVRIMTAQQQLHRQLAAALRAVGQGGAPAAASLIGLSLLYGVFHAAGPGHGKAVIATYLGTHPVQVRRGILLSVLSALAQGVMAIALVEVAVTFLGISLRRAQSVGMQAETLSFVLMVLMGLVLVVRSLRALWRYGQGRQHPALFSGETRRMRPRQAVQPYCVDCGRLHGPSRAHLAQPLSWRTSAGIVLAVGVRPCTGAILVLLVAHAVGLRWTAMVAVLAMSLGTAATVAVLAVVAVLARQTAVRLLRPAGRSSRCLKLIFPLLGAAGGAFILLMGAGLLHQALRTAAHPLL